MIFNYPAAEAVNLNHVLSKEDFNSNEETFGETNARAHTQNVHDDQIMDETSVEND